MTDITTIGEVLIDLTQTGATSQNVPLLAANPGGAPPHGGGGPPPLGGKNAVLGKVGPGGVRG